VAAAAETGGAHGRSTGAAIVGGGSAAAASAETGGAHGRSTGAGAAAARRRARRY